MLVACNNQKSSNNHNVSLEISKKIEKSLAPKIEDFLFSNDGKNISEFNVLDDEGNKTEIKTTLITEMLDKNNFRVIERNSLIEKINNDLGGNYDVKSYSIYTIKDNILFQTSINNFDIKSPAKRKMVVFDPPSIILKFPDQSNTAVWLYKEISGDEFQCTSEFVSVDLNGIIKRAIKLTKRIIGTDVIWPNTINYYVEGIGLWKQNMESTGQVFMILNRQWQSQEKTQITIEHSGEQETTLKVVTPTISSNLSFRDELYPIIEDWNSAHNSSNFDKFDKVFAETVSFYHVKLTKFECIQKKQGLLLKYPDFEQYIKGEVIYENISNDEVKCSFTKCVKIESKTTDYPSYLIIKKENDKWKISTESDLITDKNIAKRKTKTR